MYATNASIDGIIALMLKGHNNSSMTHHTVNLTKLRANLVHWINNPKCLVLVNKSVTACYILALQPSWWSDKECITDVFLYSETSGAGIRLMKESKKWINGFSASITSIKISTSNSIPEVDNMYQRMGYKPTGFTYEEVL